MIQKSKQSTLAFRVSNKLKKQVESKCKSQGINVTDILSPLNGARFFNQRTT
jgi:hypothetical protein